MTTCSNEADLDPKAPPEDQCRLISASQTHLMSVISPQRLLLVPLICPVRVHLIMLRKTKEKISTQAHNVTENNNHITD